MEMFTGATETTVYGSHFSNVKGIQYNNHYYGLQTGGKEGKVDGDLPELEEYTEVKQGDIYKDKDVCYSWRLYSNEDTETAVYHAEIMISGHYVDRKFTIKTYRGQYGREEWRRDFQNCYRNWDIPLFGYIKSSVPSLIFHGELVPFAHIETQVGLMGKMYLNTLSHNWRCSMAEIWMDPTKGSLCRGPTGPECIGSFDWFDWFRGSEIPADVEFLKEDVVIRFLSSIKYDRNLPLGFYYLDRFGSIEEVPSVPYRHVISSTTNSIIAIDRNVQWLNSDDSCVCFDDKMPDGATRFLLKDHRRRIYVWSSFETDSWLSQASSVFDAHNIRFDEDLSNLKLIYPYMELKGTLQSSKIKRQRRQLWGPIYLFLLPSPSPNTCFYFWSHDPSGRDPFSPVMCRYLGLPVTFSITWNYYCEYWSTDMYRILRDYQVARGFDPTTTDFAQSLGHPLFEVMSLENRFCEVDSEEANTSNSYQTGEADRQINSTSTQPVQETTMGSLLNTLSGWFTLDAVEGAGIPAVGF